MLRTPVARMAEIEYPERDGKPIAETDTHRDVMADFLIYPLRERYDQQPTVYVSGNLLIYYQEGNPKASVAPDVFVVFGVPNQERRVYKVWEEGKAPDVVFELTSKKTRKEDWGDKRWLYEELGVQEYFLFDPMREYLKPPLQGFRLDGAYFVALEPEQLADGEWRLESQMLGLILQTKGRILRLYDPQEEQFLRNHSEEAKGRRAAEQRAATEAEARRAAEAEVARLRALLEDQQKM
jgi:Uma2 family endonuclease